MLRLTRVVLRVSTECLQARDGEVLDGKQYTRYFTKHLWLCVKWPVLWLCETIAPSVCNRAY